MDDRERAAIGRRTVPDEIRPLLGWLVADSVEPLIAEAQADACAAVKARLRDAMTAELLAQVESALEPRKSTRQAGNCGHDVVEALWLYCIAAEGDGCPGDIPGVSDSRPAKVLHGAGLSAIVSAVPLDEFGEEPLKRNLNELEWLESTVRRHEAVLEAALAAGPVVPMPVCTIYRSPDQVLTLLADRSAQLRRALARLRGKAEWGVKAIASRDHLDRMLLRNAPAPADDAGGYLVRKQQQRQARTDSDLLLDQLARESHARLTECAVASELLPPQSRELAGYDGEMVLNAAYLVEEERIGAMRSVVARLCEQHADDGIAFELTGPWPAYHFAAAAEEAHG